MFDKCYWDNYCQEYIDVELKKDILKFYLSNNNYFESLNKNKIPKVYFDYLVEKKSKGKFSDIVYKEVKFDILDNDIVKILNYLKSIIFKNNMSSIIFPLITLNDQENEIYSQVYSIDFLNERLIYLNDVKKINNKVLELDFFSEINYAILFYGNLAYEISCMFVGNIIYNMVNEFNLRERYDINKLSRAREKGVNIYEALLIASIDM